MTLSNKKHTASKWYRCDSCDSHIAPGKEYHRLFGGFNGMDMHEMILCIDCAFHLKMGNFEEDDAFQDKAYKELEQSILISDFKSKLH